jgi:hypothetical protein
VLNLPIAATYAREESKIVPWRDGVNFARCLYRHRAPLPVRGLPVGEVSGVPANS